MKNLTPRTWTMIIAGLALAALILLAASLDSLKLRDGIPLPISEMAPDLASEGAKSGLTETMMAVFRVLMIILWVLFPVYIIYLITSKEARKRLVRDLIIMLPILFLLYLLSNSQEGRQAGQELTGEFGAFQQGETGEIAEAPPLPEFQPPPPWVSTVASLVLAAGAATILGVVAFLIWRRARRVASQPLRSIESRAREAIRQIEAGGDLSEVIQRCYLQMIEVLRQTRGIYRSQNVTPHEFEILLEERGMPREPIHQLTSLFELVRYGGQRPGRAEERIAISSLTAIVNACERAQERERERIDSSDKSRGKEA